jgi:hypothetical protein
MQSRLSPGSALGLAKVRYSALETLLPRFSKVAMPWKRGYQGFPRLPCTVTKVFQSCHALETLLPRFSKVAMPWKRCYQGFPRLPCLGNTVTKVFQGCHALETLLPRGFALTRSTGPCAIFADILFAKLDAILLLIKTSLEGEMVNMLNAKDTQVFLDYLAGGQDTRIAQERETNVGSGSVLNAAARNVMGVEERVAEQPAVTTLVEGFVSASVIHDSVAAARKLSAQFHECKDAYMDFAKTRLQMEGKPQEQAMEFAKDKLQVESKLQEQVMEFAKDKLEMEARLHEQAQQHTKTMSEFDTLRTENELHLKTEDVNYLEAKAHIEARKKESEVNHEAILLKMRLEHEMALVNFRAEEEDKKLERDAKSRHNGRTVEPVSPAVAAECGQFMVPACIPPAGVRRHFDH